MSYQTVRNPKRKEDSMYTKYIRLHHGSKYGIKGEIRPSSRENCDFGKGFYMETIAEQTQSLVLSNKFPNSKYYIVDFAIADIPEEKVLHLSGMDWAYFVLYNRGELDKIKETEFYDKYAHFADNYDVIIGPIADDNMRNAILDFSDGLLTDMALEKCLSSVDYGLQYVLKTDFACSKAKIVKEFDIRKDLSIPAIRKFSSQRRAEGDEIYREIRNSFRREGLYIDELFQKIREEERNKENGTLHKGHL